MLRPEVHFFFLGPIVFVMLVLFCFGSTAYAEDHLTIQALLPAENEVPGWLQEGPSQTASGERLFQLIGRGAETYLDEGFIRAISQNYRLGSGRIINLMVFEMRDSDGARKIFAKRTVEGGRRVGIGEAGLLGGSFLMFWEGRFQVTLTGFDSQEETLSGLPLLAKAVEHRIRTLLRAQSPGTGHPHS